MEEGGSHSSPANSTVTSANSTSSKKYYETDLDLTIKVPKKSLGSDQASTISQHSEKKRSGGNETNNGSRVINISVTKSESLNYVSQQNEANGNVINKENSADFLNGILRGVPQDILNTVYGGAIRASQLQDRVIQRND